MKTHTDAVIDAFHMSFACAPQMLEDLALIDGDDLFRLAHGRFIQPSLLLNNVMRRLTKLLQLRRKRHHNQGRAKEILCCDGSMLYTGSNPILTGRFTPSPAGWQAVRFAADVAPHHRFVPEE